MIFSSQSRLNDKVQNDCGRHVDNLLVIHHFELTTLEQYRAIHLNKPWLIIYNENDMYTVIQRPPPPTSILYSCPLSQIGELFVLHSVYNDFFYNMFLLSLYIINNK